LLWDEGDRLYLARLYDHDRRLAQRQSEMMSETRLRRDDPPGRDSGLEERLDVYFPSEPGREEDLQRAAARVALSSRFSVISGGPGTGKTSTVVKILALLAEQASQEGKGAPLVQLLAPTGKAAARMMEAIRGALVRLDLPEELRESLASSSSCPWSNS
jgi:exodeoxyribonuclease V alpha subunit